MKKRLPVTLGIIGGSLLLGGLIYGSMTVVQTECELCVEFHGQRQCRRGSGTNEKDAQNAAIRAACAVMSNGMAESIQCQNTTPLDVQCY
jgi:hypothetical protein